MPISAPPLAFSYLRFSSPSQAEGDSVRRQTELRDTWVKKTGAILDQSVSLRDDGVSGFTGKHRGNPDRHALAAFLKLVEKGRIPRGSYLVVENLDRLSREHIRPALTLLLNLIEAGIRVVQLLPVEQVFDEHVEPMTLMMAIMELSRGHSESKLKSERIGRAWAELKRKAATAKTPITPCVPAWLRVVDGKVKLIPERATVVRRMFALAAGGVGMIGIAKRLNSEGVPRFGPSANWNPSTIYKVLHNRACLGEYQPYTKRGGRKKDGDPIAGYFPAVVTEAEFWAANQGIKSRDGGGGRNVKKGHNPFAGLLWDARDGDKVYIAGRSSEKRHMLVSRRAMTGVPGSKYVSFPLDVFVPAVLSQLREIDPREVLDGPDESARRATEVRGQLAEARARVAELQQQLETGGEVRAAVEVLRRLELRAEVLARELADAEAEEASPVSTAWDDCHNLIDALNEAPNPDDVRNRLRGVLRRTVSEVWCLFVARGRSKLAAVQVWFTGGHHRDYLILYRQGYRNVSGSRDSSWWVRSLALQGQTGDFDLRNCELAAELEQVMNVLSLDSQTDLHVY